MDGVLVVLDFHACLDQAHAAIGLAFDSDAVVIAFNSDGTVDHINGDFSYACDGDTDDERTHCRTLAIVDALYTFDPFLTIGGGAIGLHAAESLPDGWA